MSRATEMTEERLAALRLRSATSGEEVKKVVKELRARNTADFMGHELRIAFPDTLCDEAADVIARLSAALARVEGERRAVLEEAAQECLIIDRDDAGDCPNGDGWVWYGKSRDHAAARIRALSALSPADDSDRKDEANGG